MKKSRFNEQQIAFILKQANDGVIAEDVCQENVRSADDRFRLALPAVDLFADKVEAGEPRLQVTVDARQDEVDFTEFHPMGIRRWFRSDTRSLRRPAGMRSMSNSFESRKKRSSAEPRRR